MSKPTFTPAELAKEARREVTMRRRVYPGWIVNGKLRQEAADRQIAMMEAIAERFEAEAGAEAAKGDLFGVPGVSDARAAAEAVARASEPRRG